MRFSICQEMLLRDKARMHSHVSTSSVHSGSSRDQNATNQERPVSHGSRGTPEKITGRSSASNLSTVIDVDASVAFKPGRSTGERTDSSNIDWNDGLAARSPVRTGNLSANSSNRASASAETTTTRRKFEETDIDSSLVSSSSRTGKHSVFLGIICSILCYLTGVMFLFSEKKELFKLV